MQEPTELNRSQRETHPRKAHYAGHYGEGIVYSGIARKASQAFEETGGGVKKRKLVKSDKFLQSVQPVANGSEPMCLPDC